LEGDVPGAAEGEPAVQLVGSGAEAQGVPAGEVPIDGGLDGFPVVVRRHSDAADVRVTGPGRIAVASAAGTDGEGSQGNEKRRRDRSSSEGHGRASGPKG